MAAAQRLQALAGPGPEIPTGIEQVDIDRRTSDQARQNFSGSREPVVLLATSLILMPRCQLKITGRIWPAIGHLRCMAAVKVETSTSPGAVVS